MRNLTYEFSNKHEKELAQCISLGKQILKLLFNYRRTPHSQENCFQEKCNTCQSLYLPAIISAIKNCNPIEFVLPAFPGKSPNTEKVLGVLPDLAEKIALGNLNLLCQEIKKIYPIGAKIILCSDGRVFSDVVGIKEKDITAYQNELENIIRHKNYQYLKTFNLDHHFVTKNFDNMRTLLIDKFALSLEEQRDKVKRESEAKRMYLGITKFLYEDSLHNTQTKSKSLLQREARQKSYEVIRRSNAWSELIKERFPHAIRLSIHPQVCGSEKIGIRLISNEVWCTPWHGVALKTPSGFKLVKKCEAIRLGANLVVDEFARPSHFELMENENVTLH